MAIPVINGAFAGQRITGQQRYATEIAAVLESRDGVRRVSIPPGGSAWRAWYRSQTLTRGLTADELLLTLTSRGPIRSRHQVVVVHDVFVLEHPEWFSRKYSLTHAPILTRQLRSAAGLVAVSEATAQAVRRHVPDDRPVVVAPNAPADVFLHGPLDDERRDILGKRGLREGGYFLCVGSLDPRKNLASLVSAHRALPESVRKAYPLLLVGTGGAAFGTTALPADDAVHSLGYVPDEDLSALYRGAAAVFFASFDEGFGLPVVESLAAGARLIVSDIPIFRWVAGSHAEFVGPDDVPGWTAAMRRAADSESVSESEREERARQIGSRFAWDLSARVIKDFVSAL